MLVCVAGVIALVGSVSTWVSAAASRGPLPAGEFEPRHHTVWYLEGRDAEALRRDALARAAVRLEAAEPIDVGTADSSAKGEPLACRFLPDEPTGTSPKFNCVLRDGEVVRVKYSRNPEIHAEAAATTLLRALGFPADRVRIVPRLRCYGCPRYPFLTARLLRATGLEGLQPAYGRGEGYTDFEWVSVEWKVDAPAIETTVHTGWAWYELEASAAPPAELDALRLLAVFLAHWDNKSDNQRLVCLDGDADPGPHACARPLLMIQDVGATFGPTKVNLTRWREAPVWIDARQCVVSMRSLPFNGATFPDRRITEAGRAELARQLASISPEQVRALFAAARFPAFYSSTDDRRDLDEWTAAFRHRVDQIVTAGPCPQ